MITLFIWTGALVWGLIALALASLIVLLLNRSILATVSMWAQVVRAKRRGVPRNRWNASPAQAWWDAFWRGSWSETQSQVVRARGPVKPWHPDERKSGFTKDEEPWVRGG